ncbi:MAG: GNVR domain-containing protein [bacterium]
MENHIEFIIADEGQIFVSVEDKIPERAAEMTNTFVALLDSIYTNLNIEKARNDRIFIGQRFEQNKSDLRNSEEALKDFQEKHGIINIPEQTKAAITSAAELQSLVYTTEIELGIKQKYLTSNHIEILQTKTKLKEFKRKLRELKVGTSTNDGGFIEQNDLYIPFEHVPEIGLNYVRLLREVEVQNKIFELLIQLYEQAKIEEAKDIPNIQILDYGAIPIYKSRPKRSIIVIVAGLFSLIITCTFIFMQQFLKNAASRQDDQAEKLKWIQSELRDDLRFIRKKRS